MRGRRAPASFPLLASHAPRRCGRSPQVDELCASLGCPLDQSSESALSLSLRRACASAPPALAGLLRTLSARAMSEAEYACTGEAGRVPGGLGHYGLALPYYTHFTSPIRRYADVLVHRQLLAAIQQASCHAAHEPTPGRRLRCTASQASQPAACDHLPTLPRVRLLKGGGLAALRRTRRAAHHCRRPRWRHGHAP